jgi:hypothetical protein
LTNQTILAGPQQQQHQLLLLGFAVPFTSVNKLWKTAELNRHILTFFHPNLITESTRRIALVVF